MWRPSRARFIIRIHPQFLAPCGASSLGATLCNAPCGAVARLRRFHPASMAVITILKLPPWPWRRIKLGVLASPPSAARDMKWRHMKWWPRRM